MHMGVIDGLIVFAGQTGGEYVDARLFAVGAMIMIADGDDEVKAGLFHFPGLMTSIEGILLDANLNGTYKVATKLASKLLQWQRHDSVTFKTCTIMLKLCSEKLVTGTTTGATTSTTKTATETITVTTITTKTTYHEHLMRAHPISPLTTMFVENSDVAKYLLSFLDTNSDQSRIIAAAVERANEEDGDSDTDND
jgi:hypothetical protein